MAFYSVPTAIFAAIESYRASTASQGGPALSPQTITLPAADYDVGLAQLNTTISPPPVPPIGARGNPWVHDGVTIVRGT